MDDFTKLAVFGGALPLALAAVVVTPFTLVKRDEGTTRDRFAWRVPLALAMAVISALLILDGWPREEWQHIVWAVAAAGLVGVVMATTPRKPWLRGGLCVFLGGAVTGAMWVVIDRENILIRAIPAGGTIILFCLLEPLARRRPGPGLPIALAIAMGGIAAFAGSLRFSTVLVALAAGLCVCGVNGLLRRRFSIADGALAVIVPVLVMMPLIAYLYAAASNREHGLAAYIIPSLSPLVLWLFELPALERRSRWIMVPAGWVLVAAICAPLIWIEYTKAKEEPVQETRDLESQMFGDFD